MAITREEVQAAVEQYLPRTVNFARSADLGERDREAVFQRMLQIVLTSLLLNSDAVFYIVFLAAQRVLRRVEDTLSNIDDLQDADHLKAITGLSASRIDDLTKLSAAKADLVSLSGGIATGRFGTVYFDDFKTNITGFLEDQVKPNVVSGNRVVTNGAVRRLMEALESSWGDVIERRGTLFTIVPNYEAEDLRTTVATTIIRALEQKISSLEATLPTLTTSEQAQRSEQILLDLAAGEAALRIVGDAAAVLGEQVVLADDGYTEADYLELIGTARVEPLQPLLKGADGSVLMDVVLVGYAGSAVDDLDADSSTPYWDDPSAPDWTATPVQPGYYLTLVEIGRTYEVVAVDVDKLTLSPEVPLTRTGLRWAVTQNPPGTFFQAATTDFWDEYSGGQTESTVVASGVQGSIPRAVLESGTDGTNVVTTGTLGVARPRVSLGGVDGQANTPTEFESPSATFLSDGVALLTAPKLVIRTNVNGNQGIYDIVGVLSQTKLLLSAGTPFSASPTAGESWHTEEGLPSAELTFEDVSATWLNDGVDFPDKLYITSGKYSGYSPYVSGTGGQTTLYVDAPIFFLPDPENGISASVSYRIQKDRQYFVSPGAKFLSNGVQADDILEISGTPSDDGLYLILVALSETVLELQPATDLSGAELNGVTYSVYRYAGHGDTVVQTDGVDFVAAGIDGLMETTEYVAGVPQTVYRQGYVDVSGRRHLIAGRDIDSPTTTLRLVAQASGRGDFTATTTFQDTTANFLAAGVDSANYQLRVTTGANAGTAFDIVGVTATELTVVGALLDSDATYGVWPKVETPNRTWEVRAGDKARVFRDLAGPFGSPANPTYPTGSILVVNPGLPNEFRVTIDETLSATEVRVLQDMDEGLTGLNYAVIPVVRGGQVLWTVNRGFTVQRVVSQRILEVSPALPNSYPTSVDWHLLPPGVDPRSRRITDLAGALAYNPITGFDAALVGLRIDLMVQQPITTVIEGVADPDGDGVNEALDVAVKVNLGNRRLAYKALVAGEGTSAVLLSATAAGLGTSLTDDVLTLWGVTQLHTVQSATAGPPHSAEVVPRLEARLTGQDFAVVRGGSQYHGRYILFDTLNSALGLADDTETLRLTVAEALLDFGQVVFAGVSSGADGELPDDGNANGTTSLFTSASALFITNGARFGDRLTVDVGGGDFRVAYVTSVVSETAVRVDPELPETVGPLNWVVDRNSVSNSLYESEQLRQQMLAFQELLQNYVVPTNRTLSNVLEMLVAQGMDRAVDLLYDGEISAFVNMRDTDASYASAARSSVQRAASRVAAGRSISANQQGINPATGKSSGRAGSLATTSSSTSLPDGSPAHIQMAQGIDELVSDEFMQSVTRVSLEELRNLAIYELIGEVESGVITDQSATLPWLAQTGALEARLIARRDELLAALQYMLDNPDEFDDVEEGA